MSRPRGRRSAVLLPFAFALGACAPRLAVHPRAAAEVERGYRHLADGDAERAEVAFAHALEFDPDFPEGENGLGVVARTRGDLASARRRFARAVRLRRDFAEGHANLGEALLALGEPRTGEAELRAALRIDPDLADARQNLARAVIGRALEAGRPDRDALLDEARRTLLHLLESAPDRAAAHHDLGFVDYLQGRFAAAERGYHRAVELDPGSHEAQHGHCISLVRVGRCAEAARACERCLELAPAADACRVSLRGARACASGP
jgi:Flp pilus assembly protein TadD